MEAGTIKYYDLNAERYFAATQNADLSHLYSEFLPLIPRNAHILDVGCGSGRDSKYFLQLGYQVSAIDASEEMARLATLFIGQPVGVADVEQLQTREHFDAIWANASLLHIPLDRLDATFAVLNQALRPGGIIYASFKSGEGEQRTEDGRLFTALTCTALEPLFRHHFDLLRCWTSQDALAGRQLTWTNILGRKVTSAP